MKLKQLVLLFALAIFTGFGAAAQDTTGNKENCDKYLTLYYQYLKQEMYRDAMNFWTMAYNYCGPDNLELRTWSNGRVAYLKLLDLEKDSVKQVGLRDTVYWITENLIARDKEKSADWSGKYGSMLVTEGDKRYGKIDTLFMNSVHVMKSDAPASYIQQYFRHLIVNKYNAAPADKKDAMRDYVIDEYLILSDYATQAATKKRAAGAEDDAKRYDAAQEFMDKYFIQIVKDCDMLTGVVEKRLTTLPQDKTLKSDKVKSYIALLDKKKCQATPTYGKLMDTLITLDPTPEAYYITGNFYAGQDKNEQALDYFQKAVDLEGAGPNKDKYTYELALAQYNARRYSAAFRTAKAVEGEYKGKAMVICGNAIAASANGCGDTTFDRKANYWLANDYYRKAAALGVEVSTSKFLDNAPTPSETFDANHKSGESVYLNCWGESTTVR